MRRSINRWFAAAALAMAVVAPARADDRSRQPAPRGDPDGWFAALDYPPEVKPTRVQHAVQFQLTITRDGKADSCVIRESSGSQALDNRTCVLVMRRGRFLPALDAGGHPIAGLWSMRFRWPVPPSPPSQPEGTAETRVGVSKAPLGPNGPAPRENPGMWFQDSEIPASVRRATGAVTMTLDVAPTGKVTGCAIIASSGDAILRDVACAMAIRNGKFYPAKDAEGRAVASTYTIPGIRFSHN